MSLKNAVTALATQCDHATTDDGQGFAKPDVGWGHYFATLDEGEWGEDYTYAIYHRLRKYRTQLASLGIDYDSLPIPTAPASEVRRLSAHDHRRRVAKAVRRVTWDGSFFVVEFGFDQDLVDGIKRVPWQNRDWDRSKKRWLVHPTQPAAVVLDSFITEHGFDITDEAKAKLAPLANAPAPKVGTIKRDTDAIIVTLNAFNAAEVNALRDLRFHTSGRYDGRTKENHIPVDPSNVHLVRAYLNERVKTFDINDAVEPFIAAMEGLSKTKKQSDASRKQASAALSADYQVEGLGVELMGFQKAGVKYAVEGAKGRCIIADEQGLGKTIESLAAAKKMNAFPLVIVCPSHLKINWEREAKKVLPGHSVEVISGRKQRAFWADINIVNYEVVTYQMKPILDADINGLIVDESQAIKNRKSGRTQTVQEIVTKAQPTTVLLLTGTPIPNRPIELITQLEALGKLKEFGGFKKFVTDFVGWQNNGFGYDFTGAIKENLPKLNERLREVGYVRRIKKDVLAELPPIRRSVVPIEIVNRNEYEAALALAKQSSAIGEITKLRQAVAKGKLDGMIDWVKTFIESGEKLIVFAHHKEIQKGLLKAFPDAAKVFAKDSQNDAERHANVDRFQNDPDCKLIICSLQAAQTGLTLTAASNVAFAELGWNPATHDQAEARCYGRVNDAHGANAYYLLAEDTVDEKLASMIDHKRAVIEASVDGVAFDGNLDVKGEFIDWLRKQ